MPLSVNCNLIYPFHDLGKNSGPKAKVAFDDTATLPWKLTTESDLHFAKPKLTGCILQNAAGVFKLKSSPAKAFTRQKQRSNKDFISEFALWFFLA
jgi:hypothetical protein